MKIIFVFLVIADEIESRSKSKLDFLGIFSTLAPATLAQKEYIPNVGSQSITESSGYIYNLNSKSINSSLPAAPIKKSESMFKYFSKASRRFLCKGSG